MKNDHWWPRWRHLVFAAGWLGVLAGFALLCLFLAGRVRLWPLPAIGCVTAVGAALVTYLDHRVGITPMAGRWGWRQQLVYALAMAALMGFYAVVDFIEGR